jgi:hypothetical protein
MVARECNMQADETHVVCHNSCFYVCVLWEVVSLSLTPYPQTSPFDGSSREASWSDVSSPPTVNPQAPTATRRGRAGSDAAPVRSASDGWGLGVVVGACVALGKSCPVERQS